MIKIFTRRYLLRKFLWGMSSVVIGIIFSHQAVKAKGDNVVYDLARRNIREDFKDEFDDEKINSFSTGERGLEVTFSKHAGIYYLPRERDDFVEQAKNLAAAWKSNKPVKIVLYESEVLSVGQP